MSVRATGLERRTTWRAERVRRRLTPPLLVVSALALLACGDTTTALDEVAEVAQPVTVCVTVQRGGAAPWGAEDALMVTDPSDPTKASINYGAVERASVGTLTLDERIVLMKFDLSGVPAGAVITSADLSFRMIRSPGKGAVDVHAVTTPWSESGVTWNTFAAAPGGGYDAQTIWATLPTLGVVNNSIVSLDVAALTQLWVNGAAANHGIALVHPSAGSTEVALSEAPKLAMRPALAVCYVPPTCDDGVQNQSETGVDCGGPCPACASCSDGMQNQGETGVDCGGPCAPCATCSDGMQNQGETGVDCGGPCGPCGGCPTGNCALRFNGVGDYISVPDSPTLESNGGPMTVEAWVYFDQLSNCMAIVRKGTASSPTFDYWLHKNFGPQDSVFWASWTAFGVNGFNAVTAGAWHHFAGVYVPGSSATVYVDGLVKGSSGTFGAMTLNHDEMRIGIDWDFGCAMDGVIDEVRISSVARYSASFAPTTVFAPDAATKAIYHFNEYGGATVHDVSGNHNDGTIHGAAWTIEHP